MNPLISSDEWAALPFLALGFFVQMSIYLHGWSSIRSKIPDVILAFVIANCIAPMMGLLGFIGHHGNYSILWWLMGIPLWFVVSATWFFRYRILPVVSERIFLQTSILFWYYMLFCLKLWGSPLMGFLFLPTIVSVLAFFLALYPNAVSNSIRTAAYVGHQFLMLILMSVVVFSGIANRTALMQSSGVDLFIYGMTCTCWMLHLTCVGIILELDRLKEWDALKEFSNLLATKFDGGQLRLLQTVGILIIQGGGLAANAYYRWLNNTLAIRISIILTELYCVVENRLYLRAGENHARG